MNPTVRQKRLPRFRRSASPPPICLTPRDLQILEWIHRCRFLTREQIQRLLFTPGAESSCKRRLTLLFHNSYVGRLFLPLRNAYGASRAVYYLHRAGVRLLAHTRRLEAGLTERPWREGEREEVFLSHTLDINEVRIAFTLACRQRGLKLEWLDERTLRRLDVRQRLRGPVTAAVILPDAYFTIGEGDAVDGFALEVDRGTVPERRMRARMTAYGEWAASGTYRRRLPAASLRVLFAITSWDRDGQRLAHLKRWCEEEGGRSLFWFVDGRHLAAADVLVDPVWLVAGRNEPLKLPLGAAHL